MCKVVVEYYSKLEAKLKKLEVAIKRKFKYIKLGRTPARVCDMYNDEPSVLS